MDSELRQVRFENERLLTLGIESLTLKKIRSKVSADLMARAERLELYVLIFVTSGRGSHMVDFHEFSVRSGSLVFVRPGQVQQWMTNRLYEAEILLFDPAALRSMEAWQSIGDHDQLSVLEWQTMLALRGNLKDTVADDINRIRADFLKYDGSEIDNGLIRSQLMVLLMRLAKTQRDVADIEHQLNKRRKIYIEFIRELETSYHEQHSVRYYVKRLGYSESTLNRTCRAECGYAAKAVIDRRVVLEAQRLLAHSGSSVAEVSHQLGFSEATNFSKYFRRLIGLTPMQFRERKALV